MNLAGRTTGPMRTPAARLGWGTIHALNSHPWTWSMGPGTPPETSNDTTRTQPPTPANLHGAPLAGLGPLGSGFRMPVCNTNSDTAPLILWRYCCGDVEEISTVERRLVGDILHIGVLVP